jgi:flagellar biosynthesis/type III secretory pathway M-ring protein FliF/YscJ
MWDSAKRGWNQLDRKVKIVIAVIAVFAILSAIFGSPSPSVPVQ